MAPGYPVRLVATTGKEQPVLLRCGRDGIWILTESGKVGLASACDSVRHRHWHSRHHSSKYLPSTVQRTQVEPLPRYHVGRWQWFNLILDMTPAL